MTENAISNAVIIFDKDFYSISIIITKIYNILSY